VASKKSSPAALAAGVVGLAVLLACWLVWRARPPQMGTEEEVLGAVDALFTAVTARDEKLLGQCEQRLHALRGAGKLPADAADHLARIIEKARAGRWQSAAERLYAFMKAQRRQEGPPRSKSKNPG
jgi:hypothetical protein